MWYLHTTHSSTLNQIRKDTIPTFIIYLFILGGMFVGLPEDPPPSSLLSKEDMEYYVQQFKKSGFR